MLVGIRGLKLGYTPFGTCMMTNYRRQFKLDTEKFADEAGFRPTAFTIHGMGDKRLSIRKAFLIVRVKNYEKYGFTFSDCNKKFGAFTT